MGTLLANFIGILILHFFADNDFSWRIGFFLGGLLGLTGLYMRFNITETPVFQAKKDDKQTVKAPLIKVAKKSWRRMLVVCFLGGVTASLAYMIRGYFNVFFESVLDYTAQDARYFTSFALFTMIIMMPFFGLIADRMGYRKFLYMICYIIIFSVIPIFINMADPTHNIIKVLFAVFLFSALASAICAPAYPYAINAFAPELRYSGVAVSWNAGIALFGGTTPAISNFLSEKVNVYAPAYYIMTMCIFFIIISFLTRKDKH
jgi:MHS family proline/betaine transporter-like MFS transporter